MTLAQPPKDFTHGEILRWRRVGGLVLAEVRYAPGQRVPRHLHPHARFVLVLAGSLTEVRGDETHRYESSSLLFRSAGEPHSYLISKSGATCLVVDVEEAWYARAQQHAPVLTGSAAFRRGFVVHLAHRLHGEFRQRDEVSRLVIESIALGMLAEFAVQAVRKVDDKSSPERRGARQHRRMLARPRIPRLLDVHDQAGGARLGDQIRVRLSRGAKQQAR